MEYKCVEELLPPLSFTYLDIDRSVSDVLHGFERFFPTRSVWPFYVSSVTFSSHKSGYG